MVRKKILAPDHLFPLKDVTNTAEADIEDLFNPSFYLQLLKGSGVADLKVGDLSPGARIVPRIESRLGKPFNHYSPSAYFIR